MRDDPLRQETDAFMETLARPAKQELTVSGHVLKPGSRVRLKPSPDGDILDLMLSGRLGVVEGIDEDDCGTAHVAVCLDDDPGRDLAAARHPAHRFFFRPNEIEPVDDPVGAGSKSTPASRRVLIACIGNIFFGDDGFGSAVAQRLARSSLPDGAEVVDFGVRGMDLAYALGQTYDAAVLVDAMAKGNQPGHIEIILPDIGDDEGTAPFDSHRMDPLAVLKLARRLRGLPRQVVLVGCEPSEMTGEEALMMGLSEPVAQAVELAAQIVLKLADLLLAGHALDADDDGVDQTCSVKES
jgi:hydrogenase maturation protease